MFPTRARQRPYVWDTYTRRPLLLLLFVIIDKTIIRIKLYEQVERIPIYYLLLFFFLLLT